MRVGSWRMTLFVMGAGGVLGMESMMDVCKKKAEARVDRWKTCRVSSRHVDEETASAGTLERRT